MYQIRHTKPADAAAQILMTIMKEGGYWWVHADEDEGFRMARLDTPYGDRLAKSGSPSLAGPFSRDTDLVTLSSELHKAQRAEIGIHMSTSVRRIAPKSRLDGIRETVLAAMEDQSLTVHHMAELCHTSCAEIHDAINPLRRYKRIVKTNQVMRVGKHTMYYWRKVA